MCQDHAEPSHLALIPVRPVLAAYCPGDTCDSQGQLPGGDERASGVMHQDPRKGLCCARAHHFSTSLSPSHDQLESDGSVLSPQWLG